MDHRRQARTQKSGVRIASMSVIFQVKAIVKEALNARPTAP
jgi:hypothetical protein